jgi:hypothetical protein
MAAAFEGSTSRSSPLSMLIVQISLVNKNKIDVRAVDILTFYIAIHCHKSAFQCRDTERSAFFNGH